MQPLSVPCFWSELLLHLSTKSIVMNKLTRMSLFLLFGWMGSSLLFSQTGEKVTLFFAGDVVLSNHIETQVGDKFDYVFGRWNEVDTSAIFMFNFEHPITTAKRKVEKEYNFKMHPKYLRTLHHGRVTLVNAANNHIADYGIAGIDDTMNYLDSAGIRYVGIGKNLEEARRPVIIEKNGKKIGFLGYHGGGKFAATRTRTGLAPRYEPYIIEDVERLRPQVDYVVVNFHWGTELAEKPDHSQIALAHHVIDAGADLIVGHHPHVLQGVETYKGKTIAYSLGNFIFGGNFRDSYPTAVLKVTLADAEPAVELVPVSVTHWQPHVSDDATRTNVLNLMRKRSKSFSNSILFSSGITQ